VWLAQVHSFDIFSIVSEIAKNQVLKCYNFLFFQQRFDEKFSLHVKIDFNRLKDKERICFLIQVRIWSFDEFDACVNLVIMQITWKCGLSSYYDYLA